MVGATPLNNPHFEVPLVGRRGVWRDVHDAVFTV